MYRCAIVGFAALALAFTPPLAPASPLLYVADDLSDTISEITPTGAVSTFATGVHYPIGLASDSAGNLYANSGAVIDKITPGGTVSTFATGLYSPNGLAFDGSGNLYVANSAGGGPGQGTISEITPTGTVSTFATGLYYPPLST
jgi:sugar lactone lactonase YvrE